VTKTAKYVFLAILLGHLLWRGLIPAMTTIDSDFPNYYVAGHLALEGRFERVYDDDWFQDQIRSFGMQQMGKFSPYPPVTAFVMMPLAPFEPIIALRAWTIINIGVLLGLIGLLSKMLNKDWLWSALLLLLSGHALVNNFRFGQFYLILSFLMLWTLYSWQRDRRIASGVLMGIGAAIKYFPILFVPLLIARKEWRIVASFLGTATVLILLSIAVLGIEPYRHFVNAVLVPHLSGNIQNRFSMNFQSWNSLLARLLLFDSALNPNPVFDSPILYAVSLIAVYVTVLTLLVVGVRKAQQFWGHGALNVEFSLLCIGGIVLFPASATYHFLLLSIPIAILLAQGNGAWCVEQKILVTLYACIGFIPYSLLSGLDGKGLLTIFAYPRLFLTTTIMAVALLFVARSQSSLSDHHQRVQIT
jgi:hypothetical protein